MNHGVDDSWLALDAVHQEVQGHGGNLLNDVTASLCQRSRRQTAPAGVRPRRKTPTRVKTDSSVCWSVLWPFVGNSGKVRDPHFGTFPARYSASVRLQDCREGIHAGGRMGPVTQVAVLSREGRYVTRPSTLR